ncbi:hypothetical protein HMPREF9332_00247 [Alloprevotella rava F0323]|uniref:Protein BatD n=1 Tax=Alloprevotella rava F0323 TaxID=679199 RepID=G5G9J6_9BACT|nr:BatD family protein [Alloprevotella rava]EHG24337.1 hypothetical protein HMPREF9332_00247 [Alloprevotella rava F0323]
MMRYIFFAVFSLLLSTLMSAQSLVIKAPSVVDRSENYFRVQFVVGSSDVKDFRGPSFSDFEVLSGPNVSTSNSIQMINGRTTSSSSTTYTYILSPRKNGVFKIGTASVTLNGRVLHSPPSVLRVKGTASAANMSSKSQPSSAGQNAVQNVGSAVTTKDLFITVTPNRKRVFEQEAILLTYKIYCRLGVGLSNIMLTRKPDFKGLVSQEIPVESIQMSNELVGGKSYRAGVIYQYVIFPQKTGKVSIPSLSFDCVVAQQEQYSELLDAFFDSGMVGVKVRRQVPETNIEVLPLPKPKPANFCGGVGQFKLTSSLQTKVPRSNDVATYRLTLRGTGNLKLIPAPVLTFPTDFDSYDPKTTYHTTVTFSGTTGEVYYDYTFVPHNVGKYEIPAVDMQVFNPATQRYETLHIDALKLNVEKGVRSKEEAQEELALRKSDISPIIVGPVSACDLDSPFWVGSWFFYISSLLVLLLGFAGNKFAGRYISQVRDISGRKRDKAGRVAEQRLKALATKLQVTDSSVFYEEFSHILQEYADSKFHIAISDFNKKSIQLYLHKAGIDEAVVERFVGIVSECEYARFAPSGELSRQELLSKAFDVLNKMEIKKR